MELQPKFSPKAYNKLVAGALCGGLAIGNVLVGAQAIAAPMPQVNAVSSSDALPHSDENFVIQQTIAKQKATTHLAQLFSNTKLHVVTGKPNARPVTDATSTNTADWERCAELPESGNHAHRPGSGGEFGFLTSTWQAEPFAHIWRSQEPAGADWSQPWEAPLRIQQQAALLLYKLNGGFGPSAWNNSANCGKNG